MTYLQDRLKSATCHEAVVDAFLYRAAHANGSEMIKI